MARISLYVPDDLKERMEAASKEVNWSDVARPALTAALAAFEHRKGGTMETAIERLRASRKQAEQNDETFGAKDGRDWAEERAEWRTLEELHRRRKKFPDEEPTRALQQVIDPNDDLDEGQMDYYCYPLGPRGYFSDRYLEAYIDAAIKFFEEVREQVERD